MSYNIIKQNGWYELEFDNKGSFRWSSTVSTIYIDGDISTFNYLLITAGTDKKGRKLRLQYEDGSSFEFITKNGWCIYVAPLRNSRNISFYSETIIPEGETRHLGLQVSTIKLSLTYEVTWKIDKLKSR
jgi:hypothetical protein